MLPPLQKNPAGICLVEGKVNSVSRASGAVWRMGCSLWQDAQVSFKLTGLEAAKSSYKLQILGKDLSGLFSLSSLKWIRPCWQKENKHGMSVKPMPDLNMLVKLLHTQQ